MKNRREFLSDALKMAAGISAASLLQSPAASFAESLTAGADVNAGGFEFTQVKLPYSYGALEPHIDALTMEIHYTRHHSAYIKNVNEAIKAENLKYKDATEFFKNASGLSAKARNNGGGAWNHNMFWQVMQPSGSSSGPSKKLNAALTKQFGSFDNFKAQFTQAATSRFGSGWAWLVNDNGILKIGSTPNQDNPLMDVSEFRGIPLLGIDVWEHAYYLKYQNKRNDYINNWWSVVNWDEVDRRFQ